MGRVRLKSIWVVLLGAFLLRLVLAQFGTLRLDMNAWVGWANRLVSVPLGHFYDQWSDYLPGYLYVLWLVGNVGKIFGTSDLLYKLPSILADVATGGLIYWMLEREKVAKRTSILTAALYLFNPAVWGNSSLWGQVDSFSALAIMGSFSLLAAGRGFLSLGVLGLGFVIKPQTALLWPLLAVVFVKQKKLRELIGGSILAIGVAVASFVPFAGGKNLLPFIYDRLWQSFNQYPYSSLNAFNLWGVGGGAWWWIKDSFLVFGISLQKWGVLLFSAVAAFLLWRGACQKQIARWWIFLAGATLQLSAFFLMTRVHERHLLPVLAPLITAAAIQGAPEIWLVFGGLSLAYTANLAYAYIWISDSFRQIFPPLLITLGSLVNGVALMALLVFLSKGPFPWVKRFSEWLSKGGRWASVKTEAERKVPEAPLIRKYWGFFLLIIVVFAGVTRLFRLGVPDAYMFDEVYHAFTAQEMVKGNKAAWEWWNTSPKGFAYEWSHPPLAKELMVVGLRLAGNSPLGWRLPGAVVGTLTVIFVFLAAWELFGSRTLAVLTALVFSLDTLPLAMSRIGMNDAYFLFFLMAALWLLLRERFLLMGVVFGFSLASKWTAIYFLALIFFVLVVRGYWKNLGKMVRLGIGSLFLPLLVYLFSYLPFFVWGHTGEQFIELQKQMWWYHTGLKATHAYQSAWWSWPLTLRPVWFYVNYGNSTVANVYAQGNPLLYWVGFLGLAPFGLAAIRKREAPLVIVFFAYCLFFLPWAFSPRIMFFYHYLPATPFLSLSTAWFLLVVGKKVSGRLALGILGLVFISFIFFYPHVTGVPVPTEADRVFYWLPSWK